MGWCIRWTTWSNSQTYNPVFHKTNQKLFLSRVQNRSVTFISCSSTSGWQQLRQSGSRRCRSNWAKRSQDEHTRPLEKPLSLHTSDDSSAALTDTCRQRCTMYMWLCSANTQGETLLCTNNVHILKGKCGKLESCGEIKKSALDPSDICPRG